MNKFKQSRPILLKRKSWLVWCLLSLLTVGYVHAQSPAMNEPITLTLRNTNLAAVMAEIDLQSNFSFSYDRSSLSAVKLPLVQWKSVSLKNVLTELTQTYGILYQVSANTIAVKTGPATRKDAGNGALRGRVVDFETATPLPGATVQLEGTSIGTITDSKGFYQLPNVPVNTYTLLVTFVGYQRSVVNRVQVEKDKSASYDIKMQTGGALKEVVVGSGPRKVRAVTHSTERQLLQEIKNATGVVSGISSELISKTADRNAAEIVKRISGITVVDDRFIVVRGMNERYNLTYLNGNVAPSTELYTKAFAYDLLPSSVIDKILVHKSPVADLVGDYAGAAIRVYTKNAMPVKHFDIGVQVAYREGSSLKTIDSYNGGKLDFLGMDDGTRKLPSFSPGVFQSNHRVTNLPPSEWLKGFSPTLATGTRHSNPDMQLFGNYYNSWRLGKARLYDLTSVTYTRETAAGNVYRQTGNTDAWQLSDIDGQYSGSNNRITRGTQTTETGKINVLENLTLKLNERHQLSWLNFFVNDGKRFTSSTEGVPNSLPVYFDNSTGRFRKDAVLSFQQRLLYSGNISGTHSLAANGLHQLTWNIGYTHDLQNVPDQRLVHFLGTTPKNIDSSIWVPAGSNGDVNSTKSGMLTRIYIKNLEQVYNGSLDYTFQVHPAFYIKAGGYQLFKTRQVGRRTFRINRAGLEPDELEARQNSNNYLKWGNGYDVNNINLLYYRPEDVSKLWSNTYFPNDNTGLAVYDITSPVDAYTASEQYNSFYVMGDWKTAAEKLTLNAGLRGEYDRQRLSGAKEGPTGKQTIDFVYVDHKKTVLLPSLNIGYRPDSNVVIRTSYGRTVNRPDFREITPYNDFDYQRNERIKGNPRVVTAVIDNYDLRAELYPRNANEVINIGVFYKHLAHPIERTREETTNNEYSDGWSYTNISYDNSVYAEIYGVEAEIKKSLAFIPGNIFRHLSVVLNGSYIQSHTERRKENNDYASDTAHKPGGPLQGQAPYIANAGLFYENVATGTKMGLVYNISGPSIYAKSIRTLADSSRNDSYYRPDLLQLPMHLLDFSITQRLIKSLQLKLSIQNILDQQYRIAEDMNFNQRYNKEEAVERPDGRRFYKGDNIYMKYKPGRYILLQFTYAF
ncbi:TonB-dependent receptor domain-containing protein [Chitinophaga sp. 22321]|uniref:TonB-dependent receptor n=1 Tax=Chitinophaga hostae TaxID=2831022 RepID=A0ABS5J8K6_9BACT|nr:TonB-dependent receptor [Chitinophaga hostae]MBS0031405.1 TonB-dependent receptor [Chitinophaga hostae]